MRFTDLPLIQAIAGTFVTTDRPRARAWITTHQRELYLSIVEHMTDFSQGVPWKLDDVVNAWENFGKSAVLEGGKKKMQLIAEVAAIHGSQCFYANRGIGACSDEVDLDRIIPGARSGKYTLENCVIACSAHNRSRGDLPIEDFLEGQVR